MHGVEAGAGRRAYPEEIRAELAARGLELRSWFNGAGDTYSWHDHSYHKTLICLAGSIVFHTDDGDVAWAPVTSSNSSRARDMPRPSGRTASGAPRPPPDSDPAVGGIRRHHDPPGSGDRVMAG